MSDSNEQLRQQVVAPAAEDARDAVFRRRLKISVSLTVAGIVLLAAMAGVIAASLQARADALGRQVAVLQARDDDLQSRGNHAAEAAQTLSSQVARLGGTPAVAAPSPGPSGPTGTPGQNGKDGRGVTGTRIDAGHLVIAYTDGTSADLGRVSGTDGPPGRSITGTSLAGSDLMVAYSDGQRTDVGPVVGKDGTAGTAGANGANGQNGTSGKDGRGVASVAIDSSSHLVVTYTDGTTEDAGQLPPGPPGPAGPTGQQGPQGKQGPPPAQWTYTDATGRQQSCTRSGGSDAAPAYNCTASTLPKVNR